MLHFFSKRSFSVNTIADPTSRHHSKRASIKRWYDKVIKDTATSFYRFKLNGVNQRLLQSSIDDYDRSMLNKKSIFGEDS